ncbi:hypothetical protein [Thiomicrospira sp. XS5]|uniref:hypothetical protein n=1 Tax=Thiomicrospira sp. XS5 TaxID=1775636 RepID=UPI000A84550D|nr:hypothetical protein [Thiomicrospira sp. XS5]
MLEKGAAKGLKKIDIPLVLFILNRFDGALLDWLLSWSLGGKTGKFGLKKAALTGAAIS